MFILNRKYEAREIFIGFQIFRHVTMTALCWPDDVSQGCEAVVFL